MKIDRNTLAKIAHLARLEVKEEEEEKLLQSLSEILTWVEKLNEIDTEDVEPLTNMSQEVNKLRDDKPGSPLEHERGLKNAPDRSNGFFKVPRIKD
jgi:aspartyl-tRNA(Asn)/glutamyl-tRNA(Gln) amidotransferase subunit C